MPAFLEEQKRMEVWDYLWVIDPFYSPLSPFGKGYPGRGRRENLQFFEIPSKFLRLVRPQNRGLVGLRKEGMLGEEFLGGGLGVGSKRVLENVPGLEIRQN
ncbi:hypothetical protein CEXT_750811 [Caerostris extrusa]|uniref:Uncharacterized protein n=1 Tax=Caerostris extrusa TaxID=172846 RepID=A0AAV4NZI4_CAEEX|nr:hypothetical protein CEXT_750811 [Caerostris extrusa]